MIQRTGLIPLIGIGSWFVDLVPGQLSLSLKSLFFRLSHALVYQYIHSLSFSLSSSSDTEVCYLFSLLTIIVLRVIA